MLQGNMKLWMINQKSLVTDQLRKANYKLKTKCYMDWKG